MPIDVETFESSPPERLERGAETNADRVVRSLASNPDQASTRSEVRDETGLKAGSVSVALSRRARSRSARGQLLDTGRDDVVAYTGTLESARAANDRLGEEDVEGWLEHAVDDEDGE